MNAPPTRPPPTRPPRLGFALSLLAIDALGIGIVIPIVPQLVLALAGGAADRGARWVGLLAASFSATQFLFSPLLGALSDRHGRRPVLLLSVLGLGVSYLLLALAPSLSWLLAARLLAGVTTANVSAVTAYIADVSPPERRGQRFGLVGAMFGLGFILGPVTGGMLGAISLRLPFYAAAALAFANALWGFLALPESLPPERRRNWRWREVNPLLVLLRLGKRGGEGRLALAWSLTWFGLGALQSTFVLSMALRFGWSSRENGIALAASGLAQTLVQAFLMRRVLNRLGEARTARLGTLLAASAHLTFALAPAPGFIGAAIVLSALGAIHAPALRALFSAAAGPERQGEAQGTLAALQSLTAIVSPLIGAAAFAHFTGPHAPVFFPGAPFALAALAYLAASLLVPRPPRPPPTSAPRDEG
jgi:DHA1 family tetracycline resistance protein-like MFS transporter